MKEDIFSLTKDYIANTYSRIPIVFSKGYGTRLWDINGKEYIDFVSGLAVNGLGHSHPNVVKAIQEQAERLMHVSNLYYIKEQALLAELLVGISGLDKVFFCNSGAEANEAAIKLARKFAKGEYGNSNRFEIVTMKNSFHGRTLAALTATGQEKFHKGFEPLVSGFRYGILNDIDGIDDLINNNTSAVMIELIQGEGGVNIALNDYIKRLYSVCKEKGILFIVDEVQTGIGRTGKMFAYQHYDIEPDIITIAKSTAGGFPIGAMLAKDNIMSAFTPGTHASTFGGNPLACAAGLATLKTIINEKLLDNAWHSGRYFINRLTGLKERFSNIIEEVRGLGLLLGLKLKIPGADIVNFCLDNGILINCVSEDVLRFLPPLIITKEDIDILIERLEYKFREIEQAKRRD